MEVPPVTQTGAHLIARALKAEGVEKVFTLAGDHVLPTMDVLADEGFQFIDTRHEQAAVDMANAWGRITGKPGVTMFTTPGHANAIPGLTLAHHTESPVINIVGSAARDRLGQGAQQEIDQVGMAKPVTRGSWLVPDPYRIPEFMAMAFRTALAGRRGPVHLTIPIDVQEAQIDESRVTFYEPSEYRPTGRVRGDPARISDAVDLLKTAKFPIAIASNGAFSAAPDDLRTLIETAHLPLFTEGNARGLVPDSHPYCFGFADWRINATAAHLKDADVVLLLGKKLDFTVSFGGPPAFAPDAKIIQVEPSIDLIGRSRGVDVAVQGDVGAVVAQMAQGAGGREWEDRPAVFEKLAATQAAERRRLEGLATGSTPLHAMDVHTALRPFLDDDTCVIFEGSDFALFGAPYFGSARPGRWWTVGTLGMIGWGVPFAVGAKLALGRSKVVLLAGDGSFGFNAMEIDTAVRHNLPVVILVGNDGVWGIDYHQQVQLYGKSVSTELRHSRYDKMAEALGAHGEHVEEARELTPALERAFAAGRPAVVNIITRPDPGPLTEYAIRAKKAAVSER